MTKRMGWTSFKILFFFFLTRDNKFLSYSGLKQSAVSTPEGSETQ